MKYKELKKAEVILYDAINALAALEVPEAYDECELIERVTTDLIQQRRKLMDMVRTKSMRTSNVKENRNEA